MIDRTGLRGRMALDHGESQTARRPALLAVIVLALSIVPAARAANVPGVHEEPRLEAAASFVAAKPVTVWCGNDADGWQQAVASVGISTDPLGFAVIAEGGAYLAPKVCDTALGWLRGSVVPMDFGDALLSIAHEAVHLSGVRDEWATDCTALSDVWGVAWRFFDVRQPDLTRVYLGALRSHLGRPPPYSRSGYC